MEHELPNVFLDGCQLVSSYLEPMGFRFVKSGPLASRRAGDWTYNVSFQSSNLNVAGEYVELTVHASVYSKALRAWDEGSAWPADASDWVAGGQLGNMRTPRKWRTWKIAGPITRLSQIMFFVAIIAAIILPFFDRFSALRRLAQEVAISQVPGFDRPEHALRFVYWQLSRESTENCISYWVKRLPSGDAFRSERDAPVLPDRLALENDTKNQARIAR